MSITDDEMVRQEVQWEQAVHAEGEGGLMGLDLDPDFEGDDKLIRVTLHYITCRSFIANRKIKEDVLKRKCLTANTRN